jgi:hypothetical protein
MGHTKRCSLVLILLLPLGGGCAAAPPEDRRGVPAEAEEEGAADLFPEPAQLPGGFADLSGRWGYLTNPAGTIDVVDLETGANVWEIKEASCPILLLDRRLVAVQRLTPHRARVVVLDLTRKGQRMLASDPIEVLDGNAPSTKDITYEFSGGIEKGQLRFHWNVRARLDGTVVCSRGAARVNLDNGRVKLLPKEALWVSGSGFNGQVADIPRAVRAPRDSWYGRRTDGTVERNLDQPAVLEDHPGTTYFLVYGWLAGKTVAALVREHQHELFQLRLLLWDRTTGRFLGMTTLKEGSSRNGWANPGVYGNGRYLLFDPGSVRWPRNREEIAKDFPVEVFSIEQEKWVANIKLPEGAKTPSVAGTRLYYVTEVITERPGISRTLTRTLNAVEMGSQRLLWQRPIEELELAVR